MQVNKKIRQIRTEKSVTQKQIANNLGVTVQSYSMKESGRRPIMVRELIIIAETLDVSPAEFFE